MSTETATEEKGGLVVYDAELPSKKLLVLGMVLGWVFKLAGVILLVSPLYLYRMVMVEGYVSTSFPTMPLIFGLLGFIAGTILTLISTGAYDDFYKEVKQGRIIKCDTFGGRRWPFSREMLIEGYSKDNKVHQVWIRVNAKAWRTHQVGDFIDLR